MMYESNAKSNLTTTIQTTTNTTRTITTNTKTTIITTRATTREQNRTENRTKHPGILAKPKEDANRAGLEELPGAECGAGGEAGPKTQQEQLQKAMSKINKSFK